MTDLGTQTPPAPPPSVTPPPPPVQRDVIYVTPPAAPPAAPRYITEEEMQRLLNEERERIRTEEKNKLYPLIESHEAQIKELTDERNARLAAAEEEQRAAAEAERLRLETEKGFEQKFDEYRSEQEERINQLIAQRETDQAIMAKERELATLMEYRTARLVQESENILPQFVDFVRGNSKEEIDASIEDIKNRTAAVAKDVDEAMQTTRRSLPLPVSGLPSTEQPIPGSPVGGGQRELSAKDIRDMSLEEFAALRPQLLEASSAHVREKGLYAPI